MPLSKLNIRGAAIKKTKTFETNSDNVLIRKISVACSPLSTQALPQPSEINLEAHSNAKVKFL